MTEEILNKGMGLRAKINFARQRIKDFMQQEDYHRNFTKNPVKEEYYSGKVKEWSIKLDNLRKEFKEL